MDLPTCPACKQSVLDDDAEDCPFCGASMKTGKPGKGKPPAPAATKPVTAPSKSTATAATPAPTKATKSAAAVPSEDEDPFAVESASQNAIPVSPKKTAGRTHEVVCPMCEAKGYVPASAAGRDVKCHNKHCMMPVYTAPALPKVEAPPPPPPPKSSSAPLLIGVAVVLIAGAAGGYWFYTQNQSKPVDWTKMKDLPTDPNAPPAVTERDDTTKPETEKPVVEEKPEEKGETPQEFRNRLLADMVEAAVDPNRNRHKAVCRRLTAMGYAFSNDLAGAREQIERLQSVPGGKDVPFYQINPLTVIAWKQLQAGRKAEAAKTLDKALALTKTLPAHGADSLDTSLELATALIAIGKGKEAAALLSDHLSADTVGQTSAMLAIARATRQFNLDRPVVGQSLAGWGHPQWVAATIGAAARGYPEQAKKFLDQVPEGDARIEATVGLADLLAREAIAAQKPDDVAAAAQMGDAEGEAALARTAARVAQTQIELDDRDGGAKTLALAIESLKKLPDLPPLRVGAPRQMLEMTLPDPVPIRQAVRAQAAVARTEAILGNTDAARQHLLESMDTARGLAPSPAAIAALQRQITAPGSQVRNELKKAYELNSDDAARRKVNELRRKLDVVEQESNLRFELQITILESAIEWGLPDAVWAEIRDHSDSDAEDYEPYLTTPLPQRLLRALEKAGKSTERGELENLMQGRKPVSDPLHNLQVASAQAVADKKFAEAARALKDASPPHSADGWALKLACRVVDQSGFLAGLQYATSLEDPLMREDALRTIGAMAGKRGDGPQFWKEVHGRSLPQTEQISAGVGITEGMPANPDAKPAE
ncbi:MAG TPA: hypothetical protein VHB77_20675 [Planctomycetaceae bacterium]|nr:hypothetical protein [Planctomycetaceae bacterium]